MRPAGKLPIWVLLACLCIPANAQTPSAQDKSGPSTDWQQAPPESCGYSSSRFEVLRAWLRTEPTTAMTVAVHGKLIFQYGDLAKVTKIASVRKSILAMLFGNYVTSGKIDMSKTVKQLGLDDKQPFLPIEERATLEQLMTARSGIYMDERTDELTRQEPNRGTEYPGTYFSYDNWEFDAAGTAFEKLTGKNIYDALESDLARPLGFQDFHRELQKKFPSPGSIHPEYAMYLSTRDMARLGLLMLNTGAWRGKQLIPYNWCRYMTSISTPWDEMNPPILRLRGMPERWGYGLAWFVWDAPVFPGGIIASPYQGAFETRGTGGQYITVLPARDLVMVHKVDLDKRPEVSLGQQEWDTITEMVLSSRTAG